MKDGGFSAKTNNLLLTYQVFTSMTKSVIISLVVIVAIVGLIVFLYLHKRHKEYNWADIESAIRRAYPDGVKALEKEILSNSIKKHLHCSTKEAHYLIGVARRKKLVDVKEGEIDLVG